MEATASPARAPLLSSISLWRRLGAMLAFGATFGLWIAVLRSPSKQEAAFICFPIVLAAILVHVDRVLPQVFVRATAWMQLGLGSFAALLAGDKTFAGIAAASGAALLVLGGAPLATEGVRRQFAPIGYRRMFLFACVTLMASSYVLMLAGYSYLDSSFPHRRAGLLSLVEGALLLSSVVGVLRMRGWGVLTAIVASACGAATFVLAAVPRARGLLGVAAYDHLAVRWLFGIAAGSALLMVAPIVVSRFVPARPSAAEGPPRAAWLHLAFVIVALAATAFGVLKGGLVYLD